MSDIYYAYNVHKKLVTLVRWHDIWGFSLKTEIYQQNTTTLPSSSSSSNRDGKDLHDQDNRDGMITHLEPDILECEVKWVLGSITMNKASGGDGIPVEPFQIL